MTITWLRWLNAKVNNSAQSSMLVHLSNPPLFIEEPFSISNAVEVGADTHSCISVDVHAGWVLGCFKSSRGNVYWVITVDCQPASDRSRTAHSPLTCLENSCHKLSLETFKRMHPRNSMFYAERNDLGTEASGMLQLGIIFKRLLILLHGGPGTRKTLTAESIAEEQKRPLYRITCGDIGIEPEDVGVYPGHFLAIGKAWGCVVLLDEADVALEERSRIDRRRNAVISIFLRVLEFYNGILILTTNRVGRFDEAFKSRIQLALSYQNLDEEQLEEIWRNLFRLLDSKRERVDIQDLEQNVHKLAKFDINGHQIRSVITMVRYLAKFRKQRLVYKHMQDAVDSVTNFNEYLQDVKGGVDEDDLAAFD
ncbi:P-loop containing nucleoside triphosphate hydrolase protein [Xylariaceae sp. AK1471]|nr:P-loop containing nucleoside triphosphate hydrolase protein [Xylariaceae sp. AK1471]